MTLSITEEECEKLISIRDAIPLMEEVFRMAGEGMTENLPRLQMQALGTKGIKFGLGALHARHVAGFKVSSNFAKGKKNTWDFLFSMQTNELLAIIQADAIGKFRTCATSAIAVKYLSPPTASVVGMYGAGRHAEAHLEAVCAVRPIRKAYVYSRSTDRCEAFCRRMMERLSIEVVAAGSPEAVPREADIIVTMTTSATPVLFGNWIVRPGLVVAAGANSRFKREFDGKLVTMAKLVVVDDKEHSKVEGGELLWSVGHGLLTWNQIEDLGKVVVGRIPVPDFTSGTILFKSHGLAIEDVAIAGRVYELARAQGYGRDISI